eukprot:8449095-Pyramimonas_sp.AAC.1
MASSGAAAAGAGAPGGAMRAGAGRAVGRQAGAGSPLSARAERDVALWCAGTGPFRWRSPSDPCPPSLAGVPPSAAALSPGVGVPSVVPGACAFADT